MRIENHILTRGSSFWLLVLLSPSSLLAERNPFLSVVIVVYPAGGKEKICPWFGSRAILARSKWNFYGRCQGRGFGRRAADEV